MLDQNFLNALDGLIQKAQLKCSQLRGKGFNDSPQSKFYNFGISLKENATKPIQQLDRSKINQYLLNAYYAGKQADVILAHYQLTLLAQLERALVDRFKDPRRALAHAAGRFYGQKHKYGFFQAWKDRLQKLEQILHPPEGNE